MESEWERDGKSFDVGTRCTLWEQLRFEICLFRLRYRFTSANGIASCMRQMEKMVLRRPSLIYFVIPALSRSPKSAIYGLMFLITLPSEILTVHVRNNPVFYDFSGDHDEIVDRLACYLHAIEFCFATKLAARFMGLPITQKYMESKMRRLRSLLPSDFLS